MSYQNTVILTKSDNSSKKYKVILFGKSPGREKTVHFGASGYSDYTKHKDPHRKSLYIARHKIRENWTKSGINTAGFWSRWILWNKPTLSSSITDTENRFNIHIISV